MRQTGDGVACGGFAVRAATRGLLWNRGQLAATAI